jgi:hypothetical protein
MSAKKTAKPKSKVERDASHAISRMPRAVKEKISKLIEDGGTWRDAARICKAAGFPGVRPQNFTNFRKGWHQEWLAKEERLEAIRRDSETTAAVVKHYVTNGGSPAEAGLLAASEIMAQALNGMGPEAMKLLIATDPKALFSVTRELARVAKLLTAKQAIEALTPAEETMPEMSEEEQMAKVIDMVDTALGIKKAK